MDGDGLARQELAVRGWAEAQGVELADVYRDEGVSGTTEVRDGLAALLLAIEEGGPGAVVVVEGLDRLARDLMVQEVVLRELDGLGARLVSVTQGADLMDADPTRRLVRQLFGALAEWERGMIVAKLRVARERARAARGKCEGRKSLREVAPEVLTRLRALRRARPGCLRPTYAQVAGLANAEGLRTVSGLDWTAGNVKAALARARRAA